MLSKTRSRRNQSVRPVLLSLEGRELLNGAMPHHVHDVRGSVHVLDVTHHGKEQARTPRARASHTSTRLRTAAFNSPISTDRTRATWPAPERT